MKHRYGFSATKMVGGTVYVEAESEEEGWEILTAKGVKDEDVVKDGNDPLSETWEVNELVELDGEGV
jgi:hypothetical protein